MARIVSRLRIASAFGGLALGSLVACTGTAMDKAEIYKDAYEDGCDSGYTQAFGSTTPRSADKDERQYTADANYRRGWYDGYRQCYADATRTVQKRSEGGGH